LDSQKNPSLASLILVNAKVITLDPLYPKADWVAVTDGRLIGLGDRKDPNPFKHKKSKILDCQGKTLLPGFIDPHFHLASFAEKSCNGECGTRQVCPLHCRPQREEKIRRFFRNLPPGNRIRGKV
jgi:predicted amidohydrolase YtcJ